MSSDVPAPKRKLPLWQLAIVALVLLGAAILVLRAGFDIKGLIERGIALIRDLGAAVFFVAMTILPAVGIPLLFFTITAGEAFAPQFGLPGVIAISLVCIALNLALGYWIARYALRPILARLMERYGYKVPRVTPENALTVTLIVRLTPGPPYAVQAVICGLAEVPFRLYMIVSWLAILPWSIGGIILGKGLLAGDFGRAAMGFGVLIVAIVLVQWVRRKYFSGRREASDA